MRAVHCTVHARAFVSGVWRAAQAERTPSTRPPTRRAPGGTRGEGRRQGAGGALACAESGSGWHRERRGWGWGWGKRSGTVGRGSAVMSLCAYERESPSDASGYELASRCAAACARPSVASASSAGAYMLTALAAVRRATSSGCVPVACAQRGAAGAHGARAQTTERGQRIACGALRCTCRSSYGRCCARLTSAYTLSMASSSASTSASPHAVFSAAEPRSLSSSSLSGGTAAITAGVFFERMLTQ